MSVNDLLSGQISEETVRGPQSLRLTEDGAVIEALATETARTILRTLQESPKTASEVTTETDSSMQNVLYHLNRLKEVGLVDIIGTRYSSKAKKMDVYAPTGDRIVVEFDDESTELRS